MGKHAENQGLKPPEDTSIVSRSLVVHLSSKLIGLQMSLFLSSLPAEATEQSLRTTVIKSLPSMNPDKLKSVVHVAKSK